MKKRNQGFYYLLETIEQITLLSHAHTLRVNTRTLRNSGHSVLGESRKRILVKGGESSESKGRMSGIQACVGKRLMNQGSVTPIQEGYIRSGPERNNLYHTEMQVYKFPSLVQ